MTAELRKFESNLLITPGCWIWQGSKDVGGYGIFTCKYQRYVAHRFSYSQFNGPIPEGMYVCHKCDVPSCVNPDHLFAGTARDNMQDMISKGRHRRGRTQAVALAVKIIMRRGWSVAEVAKLCGIHRNTLYRDREFNAWVAQNPPLQKAERTPSKKMVAALNLVINGGYSVVDAAEKSGASAGAIYHHKTYIEWKKQQNKPK